MKEFDVYYTLTGIKTIEANSKEEAYELFDEDPAGYLDIHDILDDIKIDEVVEG